MKKIRNMKQLLFEKKKLRNRQEELEKNFGYDWKELKGTLRPQNLAGDIFRSWLYKKTNDPEGSKNMLQSALSFGVTWIAKRMAAKAEKKLVHLFKRS